MRKKKILVSRGAEHLIYKSFANVLTSELSFHYCQINPCFYRWWHLPFHNMILLFFYICMISEKIQRNFTKFYESELQFIITNCSPNYWILKSRLLINLWTSLLFIGIQLVQFRNFDRNHLIGQKIRENGGFILWTKYLPIFADFNGQINAFCKSINFRDTAFIGCWMDYYVFNLGLSEPGMPCPPIWEISLSQPGRGAD